MNADVVNDPGNIIVAPGMARRTINRAGKSLSGWERNAGLHPAMIQDMFPCVRGSNRAAAGAAPEDRAMAEELTVEAAIETQGITVQRDARGLTQLRKLQGAVNTGEEPPNSPVMLLRSERNGRRVELLHRGKMVLSLDPDGAMRIYGDSTNLYQALKAWVEKSVGL